MSTSGDTGKIAVRCVGCGAIFRAPAEYDGRRAKCPTCKAEIVLHPVQKPVKPVIEPDPPLPGRGVAAAWNIIGWAILIVGLLVVGILLAAGFGEDDNRARATSVVTGAIIFAVTVAMAIVPLSVAAIINAINANTREVRRWGKKSHGAAGGKVQ